MRRREAAKAQGGVALGRSGRKPFANQLSCIAEEGKRVLRAHTLSPHLVPLRFVSTLCSYALSKVKEELMGGFSSSSSSSIPGTAGTAVPAGTAGGWRPIPATMPYYWREQVVDAAGTPRLPAGRPVLPPIR
jgi:hypothetical protein